MRIFFPYMARWHSANHTRFHHLLAGLAARGHQVTVFQSPPRPESAETNMQDLPAAPIPGLELQEIRVPPALWKLRLPMGKLWKKGLATLMTRDILKRAGSRPGDDVLLLYNIPQAALLGAVPSAIVVDVADDLLSMLAEETGPWAGRVVLPFARRAWRALLSRADLVTASSSVLADRLGSKAKLLPNGADFRRGAAASAPPCGAGPRIGYVGAFEYFVDLDLLLRTAALLPACSFDLLGGGRGRAWLDREIARRGLVNVHVRGPVPYAEALDAMSAFDVATIPFRPGPVADAAAPLKLFEYLAAGRPIVATPAEEMRRMASAWVTFASTPSEWAAAIERILKDPAAAVRRAFDARQEASVDYDWGLIVERLEGMLEESLARRKTGVRT